MRRTYLYLAEAFSNDAYLLCLAVHYSDVSLTLALYRPSTLFRLLRLIECNTWQAFLICVGCHPTQAIKTAEVAAALLKQDLFAWLQQEPLQYFGVGFSLHCPAQEHWSPAWCSWWLSPFSLCFWVGAGSCLSVHGVSSCVCKLSLPSFLRGWFWFSHKQNL